MCPEGYLDLNQVIHYMDERDAQFFEQVTDVNTIGTIKDWLMSKDSPFPDWVLSTDITSYILFIKEKVSFLVPFVQACSPDYVVLDFNASVEFMQILLGVHL